MATHCSILTQRIPWAASLVGYRPWGHKRVGHNWACTHTHTHIHMCFSDFKFASPIPVIIGKYYSSTKRGPPKLIIRFEAQVTVLSLQQFLTGLPVLGFRGFPVNSEPPLGSSPAHLWPCSSSPNPPKLHEHKGSFLLRKTLDGSTVTMGLK